MQKKFTFTEYLFVIALCTFSIFAVLGNTVGCNDDKPILVGCSRVSLRAEPCGEFPEAPEAWEVTANHKALGLLQNMRIIGEEGMWIPLGDFYSLHQGSNLIEYRAVRSGYIAGPTESIILTLESSEAANLTMGSYTIVEVRGEGN